MLSAFLLKTEEPPRLLTLNLNNETYARYIIVSIVYCKMYMYCTRGLQIDFETRYRERKERRMSRSSKARTFCERGKIRQLWISTKSKYESQKRKSVGSTKLRLRFKLLTSYFGEPPLRSGWFIPEAHCLLISPRTQPLRCHSSAHNEALPSRYFISIATARSHYFQQRVIHMQVNSYLSRIARSTFNSKAWHQTTLET